MISLTLFPRLIMKLSSHYKCGDNFSTVHQWLLQMNSLRIIDNNMGYASLLTDLNLNLYVSEVDDICKWLLWVLWVPNGLLIEIEIEIIEAEIGIEATQLTRRIVTALPPIVGRAHIFCYFQIAEIRRKADKVKTEILKFFTDSEVKVEELQARLDRRQAEVDELSRTTQVHLQ